MIYSKNYDKKEILLNFDVTMEDIPDYINWNENDNIKLLSDSEYPIDKTYKILKLK